ncbi:hypothetical protein BpHYR1_015993 [Brachionus plicatilis]|uniref:Uncharacterized protein n=1 Tax=Brachionus plicatilis TaxID=10195 RepID=A0A3M7PAU3_BRAPC|nr:hypothetical protein BpHYR1_015993 [Brachionus plicatilis]
MDDFLSSIRIEKIKSSAVYFLTTIIIMLSKRLALQLATRRSINDFIYLKKKENKNFILGISVQFNMNNLKTIEINFTFSLYAPLTD